MVGVAGDSKRSTLSADYFKKTRGLHSWSSRIKIQFLPNIQKAFSPCSPQKNQNYRLQIWVGLEKICKQYAPNKLGMAFLLPKYSSKRSVRSHKHWSSLVSATSTVSCLSCLGCVLFSLWFANCTKPVILEKMSWCQHYTVYSIEHTNYSPKLNQSSTWTILILKPFPSLDKKGLALTGKADTWQSWTSCKGHSKQHDMLKWVVPKVQQKHDKRTQILDTCKQFAHTAHILPVLCIWLHATRLRILLSPPLQGQRSHNGMWGKQYSVFWR